MYVLPLIIAHITFIRYKQGMDEQRRQYEELIKRLKRMKVDDAKMVERILKTITV